MQSATALLHASDAELVLDFQLTSCRRAFGELYSRYFKKVHGYCTKALGDADAAHDAAQEVFIKAFEKTRSLNNPQLWAAWLFRIAHNHVVTCHRQGRSSRTEPIEYAIAVTDEQPDLEHRLEKERKLEAMPRVLAQMPVRQAQILHLKYFDGKSINDIQQACGITESAVKMRLLHARDQMQRMYEGERKVA